ncbi:MAG TPA: MlaD family protein, partial [Mycobacterium sp.]
MSFLDAIRRRLRSRLVVTLALVVVAAVVAAGVVGAKLLIPKVINTRALCAEFTDAVGLYPGNNVALLGIDVGTVTAVTNEPDHVQVDFTVPADLDL